VGVSAGSVADASPVDVGEGAMVAVAADVGLDVGVAPATVGVLVAVGPPAVAVLVAVAPAGEVGVAVAAGPPPSSSPPSQPLRTRRAALQKR
jgi:hypothetical protein